MPHLMPQSDREPETLDDLPVGFISPGPSTWLGKVGIYSHFRGGEKGDFHPEDTHGEQWRLFGMVVEMAVNISLDTSSSLWVSSWLLTVLIVLHD